MTALLLAWIVLATQIGYNDPGAESAEWLQERTQQTLPLGTSTTIEIRNEFGDIRCRAGAVEQIEFVANAQRLQGDPHQAKLDIRQQDGRMVVEVRFIVDESRERIEESSEMKRRRVDLTVIMPAQAKLEAHTRAGLIEAKGLENDFDAVSSTGDIVISSAAEVRARTEHGSIKLDLKSDRVSTLPSLETVTGNVELWLPFDANLKVVAETQGSITTDYSVDIRREARTKHVTAQIGKGGKSLKIKSIRGAVSLFQSSP